MLRIKDITTYLESWAPSSLQESYDNSGLLLGEKTDEVNQVLISLDITEEVIDEAIATQSDFIIAHHPFIFKGLKKIGDSHWIDRCIRKAIKNDIAIYAIHTNLDNIHTGVNKKIAEKVGLSKTSILQPKKETLSKLTVFMPVENKDEVLNAMYAAGAGNIGNYDHCSFQIEGTGTFRGNEDSNPTIGNQGEDESVQETRCEVLVPTYRINQVLNAMNEAHPYEEVAHYINPLSNINQEVGAGMIGHLPQPAKTKEFLLSLKKSMNLDIIRHTKIVRDEISKVAICGGSGSFLLKSAIAKSADIFITADFKYHDFFEANEEIIIADIGHYESEVFTKELLQDALTKNFTKFAFRLSKVDTNPIKYL
ncbi:dinuclear metal center protein, YbgI/SA1388 family [Ekhidna lutea]|uniref:GTP cyclohydrolase 1 type 2 homolog n=2 Tax=Ekhidna lutea TaxID=447679 RepID=A0A239H7U6_EKHLU|nr:dinuclear metal center protein, YbgI/SA1388 family [Ekhidna lutea]